MKSLFSNKNNDINYLFVFYIIAFLVFFQLQPFNFM